MDIRSNGTNSGFSYIVVSFFNLLHKNMIMFSLLLVIIFVLYVIGISIDDSNDTIYDCSKLTDKQRANLNDAINYRLKLIEKSMNASFTDGYISTTEAMQDNIETIMLDTRKEFCIPKHDNKGQQ